MSPILHLRKQLACPPVAGEVAGIRVRNVQLPHDISGWIALRRQAMAGERPAARAWSEADFQAEMTAKPWWRAEHSWVAVLQDEGGESNAFAGAVTLAVRSGREKDVAVAHWLMVDPHRRRRGIGRALMQRLERAAWDAGWREVQLETHAGWAAAVAFYQSMGYESLRDRSPR